ncbi:MAG: phosphotransacetylase family protein [Thermaerobacter sp.]|jgi:hypothetical protein|nr:phosphotransacetylase family protein [Thermaerobacter sp.]
MNLAILSPKPHAGKSALCLGLGYHLKKQGRPFSYLKLVGDLSGEGAADAAFLGAMLELADPPELLSPLRGGPELLAALLRGEGAAAVAPGERALEQLLARPGTLLVEGAADLAAGCSLGLDAVNLAQRAGARAVLVVDDHACLGADWICLARRLLGERLGGVVYNRVPVPRVASLREDARRLLARTGPALLGILPEDRLLNSLTVAELAEILGGEVLCASDRTDAWVEHYLVGAMHVESALRFFRRTPAKAVITGGDRSDIQLAALETGARCLILTGNLPPAPAVLGRAADQGVPMLLVAADTLQTVERLEEEWGRMHLRHPKRARRVRELVEAGLDWAGVDALLDEAGNP